MTVLPQTISACSATTLEGLRVKARAVQWQLGVTEGEGLPPGGRSNGMTSIVEDFLRPLQSPRAERG